MSLLSDAIAGHGGLARWQRVESLTLRVRIGGHILASRFASPRTRAFEVRVDTRRVCIALRPFPALGHVGVLEDWRVRIETDAGVAVSTRDVLRDADGRVPR